MMTERQVITALESFNVSATESGTLQIGPRERLTPELREAIRTHKGAILDELEAIRMAQYRAEWDAIEPMYAGWASRQAWLKQQGMIP